jgi:hypothetical protein
MELEVHGWRCIDGEVQLRVRLTDGSIGCVPIGWTNLLGETQAAARPAFLSLESLRALRQLTELLQDRRHASRHQRTSEEGQP